MGCPYHLTFIIVIIIFTFTAHVALANTEIINFAAGNPTIVASPFLENDGTSLLSLSLPLLLLREGANEIVVHNISTPAPQLNDSFCDVDEDGVVILLRQLLLQEHQEYQEYQEYQHLLSSSLSSSCAPHELWLLLDLDGGAWTRYDRFTLRVSWAASNPIEVSIKLYPTTAGPPSPSSESERMKKTRLQFARIRLTQEGVRVPAPAPSSSSSSITEGNMVPLVVLLEPLVFGNGWIPASVLPVFWTLIVVLSVASWMVLPFVCREIECVAWRARKELGVLEEKERERKKKS